VGLLDADIYGPSIPMMLGITDKPRVDGNRILPFERYGLKAMSLGFLLDTDTPVIWRGPMVMKALEQLLGDVEWGELDYLVVDLPPGTGDAQLTITQRVPLSGAVIVTTPQDVALIDARKGLAMFRKVNVPVLGIIENMSTFRCPHCGETTDIFKHGGGERTADLLGTTFLGRIPLDPRIVEGGDSGVPIAVADHDGPHGETFRQVAESVVDAVEKHAAERPRLSIV
jgi:ATP-binding protein involved in chromosome partitioning